MGSETVAGSRVGTGTSPVMGTGTEREVGRERERERERRCRRTKERKMGTGAGAGPGFEAHGRTQDGNEVGSGDGNQSSSGDGNGDEDGNGDGNGDGIGDGGGEAKKRKKTHKNRRHDQALLFRTRRHLFRQGVALAGTRLLPSQGLVPVHTHRTEGVTGSEGRGGTNTVGGGNGDGNRVGGRNGNGDGAGGKRERGWTRTRSAS